MVANTKDVGLIPSLLVGAGLIVLLLLAFMFPFEDLGAMEIMAAWLIPFYIFKSLQHQVSYRSLYLSLVIGFLILFRWMIPTLHLKGDLGLELASLVTLLFVAYESLGIWVLVKVAHVIYKKRGAHSAAWAIALGIIFWEGWAFRIYPWTWGSVLGSVPWTATSAAWLSALGLSALLWGTATWSGLQRGWRTFLGPLCFLIVLGCAHGAWLVVDHTMVPTSKQQLDIVVVQSNFPAGQRSPDMEPKGWSLSDQALNEYQLPHLRRPTLVLWGESSILGRDDRGEDARLRWEASRRNIAWLFGTEGGNQNLIRGEVSGRPSFIQAKVIPMDFGERMPGPESIRHWLDKHLGWVSQIPGELSSTSKFVIPITTAPSRSSIIVHPLLCSEGLLIDRVRKGVALTQPDLLTNHTNDAWFEKTGATFLHAAQVRLRAVEMGRPLIRATLSGASGIFLANGHSKLWSGPQSEMVHVETLEWSNGWTLASWNYFGYALVIVTLIGFLQAWIRKI
ncbi:MAG: hypothetical protein ACKN9J_02060 [Holophagaceae bacterium]